MKNRTCEHCCKPLKNAEVITCNPCAADQLRTILSSKAWRKIRGQTLVTPGITLEQTLRTELKALEG